jgi:hypothetical protein
MLTPYGSLVETQRNMAKKLMGFLEKPTMPFAIFSDVGIYTRVFF